ncbi:MAG: radical SAM family heme chaperone HemW [Granulosicoccus sp.]
MSTERREFQSLPPLGLYVHIPWCIKKCPYCDFNSHEQREELPEDAYVDSLLQDLADEIPKVWGRTISSVFIGGGTPSLFSAESLDKLLSGIRALTALAPSTEITLEANPGTFEQQRFKDYRTLGINRLSIGVQSFSQSSLEQLGRAHSAREAFKAIEIAHEAQFDRINLDIMFALPGQTQKACLTDIRHALSMSTSHLSCYELTLEPNTVFARFPPQLPDDDSRARMQELVAENIEQAGLARYEISAYARTDGNADHRSQHNMNYWLFGDYIGIGAGAHGKISSANTGDIVRRWKKRQPKAYLAAQTAQQRLAGEEIVSTEDTALEFLMNALRLRTGFPLPLFHQHTGVALDRWSSVIDSCIDDGLLQQTGLSLHASERGYRWLNNILERFLDSTESDTNSPPPSNKYPTMPIRLQNSPDQAGEGNE